MKLEQLYQIHVERRDGTCIPIAPRMSREALEPLLVAINAQIALGNEREWSNPHLVPVKSF